MVMLAVTATAVVATFAYCYYKEGKWPLEKIFRSTPDQVSIILERSYPSYNGNFNWKN